MAGVTVDHSTRRPGTERLTYGRQALDILPWTHTVFGYLKTWLRDTVHVVSPKHLQRYLDEFSYRFGRRWREAELFGFVLRRVAGGQPRRSPRRPRSLRAGRRGGR